MPKPSLALGLMSGTSADGLALALCSFSGRRLEVLGFRDYPYAAALRARILAAKDLAAPELSALNFELGRLWAGMVRDFCSARRVRYRDIAVIGSHGQTVWHSPGRGGHTLQIGEASFIAEETGRPVVCDFRPADMAAGGEGAPLVPFLDEYLYGGGKPTALQNIGGVGNISFVGRGVRTRGFDTGPGNSLMDTAAVLVSRGLLAFDRDGALAAAGRPDEGKVRELLKAPFFRRRPPKSLDRSEYALAFLKKRFGRQLDRRGAPDLLATLNLFTAASVKEAFARFAPRGTAELIVSGGGALNPVLLANISRLLAPAGVRTRSAAELGMHPLAKEPACFALLALLALKGRPNHCPAATGARGRRVLGKLLRPAP